MKKTDNSGGPAIGTIAAPPETPKSQSFPFDAVSKLWLDAAPYRETATDLILFDPQLFVYFCVGNNFQAKDFCVNENTGRFIGKETKR